MSYCTIMWITAWNMLSVCVSANDSWLFLPCLPPLSSFIVYGNTLKPLTYMQSAGVCPSGPLQMVLCISQCQGPLICLTVSSLHADNRAQIQTRSTCWGLRKLLHVFFFSHSSRLLWGRRPPPRSGVPEGVFGRVWGQSERREAQQPPCDSGLSTQGGGVAIVWHYGAAQERSSHWRDCKSF